MPRPIIAFDVETIPDPDLGRRVWGLGGSEREVIEAMMARRLEETDGRTGYPPLPWHRVVAVCVTTLEPTSGAATVRALGGDAWDERSHIEGFFALFRDPKTMDPKTMDLKTMPRLVSWNGSGFDIPVLRYRAMTHGIAAPAFYSSGGRDDYLYRYGRMHVDVMDELSSFGASPRAGLEATSQSLGLGGKSFIEGQVYENILAEKAADVAQYCKLDTLHTMLVYLAHAHHKGDLPSADFERMVSGLRAAVAGETHPTWRAVGEELAGWPAWGGAG